MMINKKTLNGEDFMRFAEILIQEVSAEQAYETFKPNPDNGVMETKENVDRLGAVRETVNNVTSLHNQQLLILKLCEGIVHSLVFDAFDHAAASTECELSEDAVKEFFTEKASKIGYLATSMTTTFTGNPAISDDAEDFLTQAGINLDSKPSDFCTAGKAWAASYGDELASQGVTPAEVMFSGFFASVISHLQRMLGDSSVVDDTVTRFNKEHGEAEAAVQ